jgi:plasmid maintenance system antidote protein VapI
MDKRGNGRSRKGTEQPRKGLSLSGVVRRTMHAHALSPSKTAKRIGIQPVELDEFLAGEQTLPSDVLDRLCKVLRLDIGAWRGIRNEAAY